MHIEKTGQGVDQGVDLAVSRRRFGNVENDHVQAFGIDGEVRVGDGEDGAEIADDRARGGGCGLAVKEAGYAGKQEE